MLGPRTAPRSKRARARWSRSLVREQRDSILEGAGLAGQPSHPFTVGMLALRHPSNGTVETVAPWHANDALTITPAHWRNRSTWRTTTSSLADWGSPTGNWTSTR